MLRILHVGLGPLGRKILDDLAARQLGTVVAAVDLAPELCGQRLAELVPALGGDVRVTEDLDAARASGPIDVAVVTTSSDLRRCADTFRDLLGAGLPVVSTCEELLWPRLRHTDLADELDALAREKGGRLLGTGVNPGFLMDTLPSVLTSVSRSVDSVDVWRIQDATDRRVPFQQKIGAALDEAAFAARVESGTLRHVGLGESLHFTAAMLGLGIDRWDETIEPVIATQELACALGPIPPGHSAGVRQVAEGFRGDERKIRLEFQAAIGQADPHDRVLVHGEPPLDLRISGGVHGDVATSAIALNVIPSLLAAPPGLHTMASIPLPHFAAPARS